MIDTEGEEGTLAALAMSQGPIAAVGVDAAVPELTGDGARGLHGGAPWGIGLVADVGVGGRVREVLARGVRHCGRAFVAFLGPVLLGLLLHVFLVDRLISLSRATWARGRKCVGLER